MDVRSFCIRKEAGTGPGGKTGKYCYNPIRCMLRIWQHPGQSDWEGT